MYIKQIDVTRFIAALSVVIFHYGTEVYPFNQYPVNKLVPVGPISVSYFFTLSGFILAYVYYNKHNNINFDEFYVARFARIYPIYFLSLLPFLFHGFKKGNFDFNSFLLHVFMLQSFLPIKLTLFNIPSWAISVEAAFYIIFPLLMKYIFRYGKKSFLFISIVVWSSSQILHIYLFNNIYDGNSYALHHILFTSPLFHLNAFLLGCAFGVYFNEFMPRLNNRKLLNNTILLLSFSAILFTLLIREDIPDLVGFKVPFTNGLMAPLFLMFIFSLSIDNSLLKGLLKNKVLVKLGEASYCIYIFQAPFNYFFYFYIGNIGNFSDTQKFYIYLIVLILISVYSLKFIELPLRNKIISYCHNNKLPIKA
jgi:peptidoglycan/LPS O-acetylase OafA/YrhL